MTPLRRLVSFGAAVIRAFCLYALLHGNGLFRGAFENEPIPCYFLAKASSAPSLLPLGPRPR